MRLIDADALKRRAQRVATEAWKMELTAKIETTLNQFIDWINDAPTIEPERKTGKWIYDENGMDWNLGAWVCSECHCRNDNIPPAIKFGNEYKRIADPNRWQGSKFCPNCGADMRGEQDG